MVGKFREDVEGLRAIAVLTVLLFHIAPRQFSGGFVGVDVFFVISGFVITRGIWQRVQNNDFSLRDFYARRAKRILPANFAVVALTLVAGYFFLLPHEYVFLAESAIATAFFVANMFFMLESDYFNPILETNALLHMWSLSVEEQFYLFFPLIMSIILIRGKFLTFTTLSIMAVLSFLFGLYIFSVNEAFAFFLAPARFWQFIVGAMLALAPPLALPRGGSDGLAGLGLAAILASTLLVPGGTTPPVVAVLPATLGAAAVILAGGTRPGWLVTWGLCNPLVRFVGRISYSVYLVHWPLVVFYEMRVGETDVVAKAGLLAASLILGALLWRVVEQPGLKLPIRSPAAVAGRSAAAFAGVVAIALAVLGTAGFPQRYPPEALRIADALERRPTPGEAGPKCVLQTGKDKSIDLYDAAACLPSPAVGPRIVIMGDSHANQYVTGFTASLPHAQLGRIVATGCRPLLDAPGNPICQELHEHAFATLLPAGQYDVIVLAGRWQRGEIRYMRRTVERAAQLAKHVVVLGPIVEYTKDLPRILVDDGFDVAATAASPFSLLAQKTALDAAIREELAGSPANYVSILDIMCPEGRCIQVVGDTPVQYDYGHLTKEGSTYVVGRMTGPGTVFATIAPAALTSAAPQAPSSIQPQGQPERP